MKILIRLPVPPPNRKHKDKKRYSRKPKHRRENALDTRY